MPRKAKYQVTFPAKVTFFLNSRDEKNTLDESLADACGGDKAVHCFAQITDGKQVLVKIEPQ